MIVVLKENAPQEKVETFLAWIQDMNLKSVITTGEKRTVISLIGDTSTLDINLIQGISIVDQVQRVSEPYHRVNRKSQSEHTRISIGNSSIGEGTVAVIAGPCSVESEEQIEEIARFVQKSGAALLRGGAFKPRTSPYSFQGLGKKGIDALVAAGRKAGIPVVTEVVSPRDLEYYEDVDLLQVGARNTQNFELLKEIGKIHKPVLLKRGIGGTLEEFLMSAEYIISGGNEQVIFCERGIRTYETATRNTLDISAVPFLKARSHLPVIVDPSHAAGNSWMVPSLSRAAIAAGADGIMVEVHSTPETALSDGAQSLHPEEFEALMKELGPLVQLLGKTLESAGSPS